MSWSKRVAAQTAEAEGRDALRRQADLILSGAETLPQAADRRTVSARYVRVVQLLGD